LDSNIAQVKISAIIPAAGHGLRFGGSMPKQFKNIGGRPLLLHTVQPFVVSSKITEIIIAVPSDWIGEISELIAGIDNDQKIKLVAGGERRQDSVNNGLQAVAADTDIVVIHDAGRPFVTEKMIDDCISACEHHAGAIIAMPARDTVKSVATGEHHIEGTIPRSTIWLAQTPQAFQKDILTTALLAADSENISGTDEAALVERLGHQVAVVEGSPKNIKITTPEDWQYAATILEQQ